MTSSPPLLSPQIKLHHEDEGVPGTALREISLLKDLSGHKNIVQCVALCCWLCVCVCMCVMVSPVDRLKDVALEGSRLYLVFEFVDKDLRGFYSELKPEVKIDMKLVKVCVCVVCVCT